MVSFTLRGRRASGRSTRRATTLVTIPATRVPLTVDIEGVSHPFILDTGASEVTVRSSVFATLTADQRAAARGPAHRDRDGPHHRDGDAGADDHRRPDRRS